MHDKHYKGEERRRGFTSDEVEQLKGELYASIFEDIGRGVVKKLLRALGTVAIAVLSWLGGMTYADFFRGY